MREKQRPRRESAKIIPVLVGLTVLSAASWLGLLLNQVGVEVRLPPVALIIGIALSVLAGIGMFIMILSVGKTSGVRSGPPLFDAPPERTQSVPFIDGLTGIASRAWFDWTLNVEIQRSKRYGHPLSVILVEIDHFSEVQRSGGNAAGDYLLMKIAEILSSRVRQTDQAARLRGEQYAVIASETDEKGARVAAEKLRRAVEIYPFDENFEVTISAGVTGLTATDTPSSILERAERALEAARAKGGNSVAPAAG